MSKKDKRIDKKGKKQTRQKMTKNDQKGQKMTKKDKKGQKNKNSCQMKEYIPWSLFEKKSTF